MRKHLLRVRSLGQKMASASLSVRVGLSSFLILALIISNLGRFNALSASVSLGISPPPQSAEILVSIDETAAGSAQRHAEWRVSLAQLTADINLTVSNLTVDGRQTSDITELLNAGQVSMDVLVYGTNRPITIQRVGDENTYETSAPGIQYRRLGNQLVIIKAGEEHGRLTISGAAGSAQESYVVAALLISLGAYLVQTEDLTVQAFYNVEDLVQDESSSGHQNDATVRSETLNLETFAINEAQSVPFGSGAVKVVGRGLIGLVAALVVADIIRDKALAACVQCCQTKHPGKNGTAIYSFTAGCRCNIGNGETPCP